MQNCGNSLRLDGSWDTRQIVAMEHYSIEESVIFRKSRRSRGEDA